MVKPKRSTPTSDEELTSRLKKKTPRTPHASISEAFPTRNTSEEVTITLRVPKDFRTNLKRLALETNTTMKDVIVSRFPELS